MFGRNKTTSFFGLVGGGLEKKVRIVFFRIKIPTEGEFSFFFCFGCLKKI